MTSSFSKTHLENLLIQSLQSSAEVSAAWLGGSRATDSEDDLSDIDLVLVSKTPDQVFAHIEELLNKHYTITHCWNVPASIWKQASQKFYVLKETPQTFYLDISIFATDNPQDLAEFFNLDRHGKAQILFDKNSFLAQAAKTPRFESLPPREDANLLARSEVIYRTFLKEHQRGRYTDTVHFYDRLVSLWVQMKRSLHTPQKHDFGLRYIYRDFPHDDALKLERLLRAREFSTMKICAEEVYQNLTDRFSSPHSNHPS